MGIPRLAVNDNTLTGGNINLINAGPAEIVGADGEFTPFENGMAMEPIKSTLVGQYRHGAHVGHAMLQTVDGKYYEVIHQEDQVFAMVNGLAVELPLVNGEYITPGSVPAAKLVMVMDDGRQFDMSSSDGKLYVVLPDGNKSPVNM